MGRERKTSIMNMDSASSSEEDEYEQPTQQNRKERSRTMLRHSQILAVAQPRHRQLRKWTSRRLGVPPKHLQPCHSLPLVQGKTKPLQQPLVAMPFKVVAKQSLASSPTNLIRI